MEENLTITELSTLLNISAYTIRFYEKEGLLTTVSRTQGGSRRYDMTSISELEAILLLRESGIPLKDIKEL